MSAEASEGPSTSGSPSKEKMDAKLKATNLLAQGKRNMVCQEVPTAVQQFQDACQILSLAYGEMAMECADAYFQYGCALLELSRMEQGVLGNALDGVDVDADDDGEPNNKEQFESTEKLGEEEREKLREQVYIAMSEDERSKSGAENGDGKKVDSEDAKTNGADTMETEDSSESKDTKENSDSKASKDAKENGDSKAKDEEKKEEKVENSSKQSTDEEIRAVEAKPDSEPATANGSSSEKVKENEKSEMDKSDKEKSDKEKSEDKKEAVKEISGDKKEEKSDVKEEKSEDAKEEKSEDAKKKSEDKEDEDMEISENGKKEKSDSKLEEGGSKKDEEKTEGAEEEEEGEGEEEEEEEGDEEEAEESQEEEKKEGEEDPDDISNLQLAWEVLELSKIIYSKDFSKDFQLKAAESCLKLGEVSLETEQYDKAVSDLESCLKIQKEHLEPFDRAVAETHYQLGLACHMNKEYNSAIGNFKSAVSCLEKKIEQLRAVVKANPPKEKPVPEPSDWVDPAENAAKEIKEIESILPEIKEKITDAEDESKTLDVFKTMAKEAMGSAFSAISDIAGDSGFGSSNTSGSSSKSPVKDDKKTSDISHLIRKKRKTDEEEKDAEEIENKKAKQEDDGGDAPALNGRAENNGNTMETAAAT